MIIHVGTGAARLVGMMTNSAVSFDDERQARVALRFLCTPEADIDTFDYGSDGNTVFDNLDYIVFCLNEGETPWLDKNPPVLHWWVTAVMPLC